MVPKSHRPFSDCVFCSSSHTHIHILFACFHTHKNMQIKIESWLCTRKEQICSSINASAKNTWFKKYERQGHVETCGLDNNNNEKKIRYTFCIMSSIENFHFVALLLLFVGNCVRTCAVTYIFCLVFDERTSIYFPNASRKMWSRSKPCHNFKSWCLFWNKRKKQKPGRVSSLSVCIKPLFAEYVLHRNESTDRNIFTKHSNGVETILI